MADIDQSIEFYTKKLGFELDFRQEDFYAGISKDGWSIHLKTGSPSIEERQRRRNNEDLDVAFSVVDVEELYAHLSKKHIEFVQKVKDHAFWKEFYITDPRRL